MRLALRRGVAWLDKARLDEVGLGLVRLYMACTEARLGVVRSGEALRGLHCA